jgi:outer membrane protein OmpA-like peptidoglycan-associated protein
MHNNMKFKLILFSVMFLTIMSLKPLSAQEETQSTDSEFKYNTWSAYVGGGWFQYYGDIARANFYPGNSTSGSDNGGFSWDIMGGANYWFNPIFGLNANLGFGKLYTQKQDKYDVTLASTAIFYDLNGVVSLSNLFFPRDYNKKYNAYFSLGVGNAHYRSLLTSLDGTYVGSIGYENSGVETATTEGDKSRMNSEATYKIAGGLKYKISKRIAVGLEVSMIQLPTDHFDVRYRVLSEKDALGYTNLLVQYTFGKNEQHNEWNPVDPTMAELLKRMKNIENDVDSLKKGLDDVKDDVDVLMKDYDKRTNSPDSDGDGVPDYMDLEPNSPKGAIVNFQGIALPIEKDKYQRNPDGSFKFDPNANPILKDQPKKYDGIALYSVYFPLNSTFISHVNHEKIAIAANLLKKYPDMKFELIGSACEIATTDYNENLSKRRVNVVKDILVKDYGIDSNRLIVSWVGELKPLSNSKHRLFINRRVDIFIAK